MKKFEHGGNIHQAMRNTSVDKKMLDFSANINPLGPPEWLRPLLSRHVEQLVHYPDPENIGAVSVIAKHHHVSEQQVVLGNGTTELLYVLMRAIEFNRVVLPVPSYVDYVRAAELAEKQVVTFELSETNSFALDCNKFASIIRPGDLCVVTTPNNPTGTTVDRDSLITLAKDFPDTFFIIDEAFIDFIAADLSVGGVLPNLFTINSMTKFYGVPGLRVGYGIFTEKVASSIKALLPPWSVNTLAQAFVENAFADRSYQDNTRAVCNQLRGDLIAHLAQLDCLKIFPSTANYLFIKLLSETTEKLYQHCRKHNILIRRCNNYQGLDDASHYFRIAVRTEKENNQLVDVLKGFFRVEKNEPRIKQRRAGSIMFQGTCSDAGKSILTAGLCRVLFQDGVNVAPFKAQNMSLNSFVTHAGDEMGRAQVVQAQAARLDPDCRMNPILLKPNSDTGSQIIVGGKPVGNMTVNDYNSYKPKAWETVKKSYDSLSSDFDAIVLEGAGSPGEVNLKHDDIVNMRMARYAESPVVLVGDIDRGGVYASFVGIMEVLSEWERDLVAGFLVNKFRGQASLLESAHHYVEAHTGKNVLGVLPYLPNLGLPEEDSVSFKKGSFNTEAKQAGVEIALINLPHISNFTDIEPFLEEPDVSLTVVDTVDQLTTTQAIIIPGSKNVIHDLEYLKANGFVEAIRRHHENGVEIIGICGGYQILGSTIEDPYEIESSLGQIEGIGLLKMKTVIEKNKNLTRKTGVHKPSGLHIFGYEIHHGISSVEDSHLIIFEDRSVCGTADSSEQVWGSYLHGIFDSDSFRRWFINRLRSKIGLKAIDEIVAPYDLENAFDRLADSVRENLDMDQVYSLLRL